MSEEDSPITREETRSALARLRDGTADFDDVMCLVNASFEREIPAAPEALIQAVVAKFETDRDYANGGADQFVWNKGVERARLFGHAWRAVGAVENGDLLSRLADEFDEYEEEVGKDAIAKDVVRHFHAYRRRVQGPNFGIPDRGEELFEVMVEWAIEHADEFPDAKPK